MKATKLAFAVTQLFTVLSVSAFAAAPTLELPNAITLLHGAPLHIPLDGFDADGET